MCEPLFPLLAVTRLRMGIDGRGVTTLVSGRGCPLRCRWCINKRLLARGRAVDVTAQALYERVRCDDLYFRATGGGVTFGGGEALLHTDFFPAFRAVCGDAWRLCAETSLAVPRENVARAAETIDEFIVDCKSMDAQTYRAYTGGDGALMEGNLRFLLDTVGPERVVVRVPLIPEFNTPQERACGVEQVRRLGAERIDVFEYVIRPEMRETQTQDTHTYNNKQDT